MQDTAVAHREALTGFLAWISRGEVTVKRRTDEAADEVRVMTVHGAKGLQAPVVILPDTANIGDIIDEKGRQLV